MNKYCWNFSHSAASLFMGFHASAGHTRLPHVAISTKHSRRHNEAAPSSSQPPSRPLLLNSLLGFRDLIPRPWVETINWQSINARVSYFWYYRWREFFGQISQHTGLGLAYRLGCCNIEWEGAALLAGWMENNVNSWEFRWEYRDPKSEASPESHSIRDDLNL